MSLSKRPASTLAVTLTLLAASAGMHNFSAHSLALDFSPLHRDALPTFHAETYNPATLNAASYNPATPPQLQINNATRRPVDRHPRHRAL